MVLFDVVKAISDLLSGLDEAEKIDTINKLRLEIHKQSPLKTEPVDCVQWINADKVQANDYNPNAVAPPEMELLERSIHEDGYTQPIVAWINKSGVFEVVDGFHRSRVGKESKEINERIHGYLPLTIINSDRIDRGDRIAATIRHNRARGKHKIDAMSDIVVELKRRNWSNNKIAKELGMDPDEVLRLLQITGLAEMFAEQSFSRAWDIGIFVDEDMESDLIDDVDLESSSLDDRIYHTWEKWECYEAGFFNTRPPQGMTDEDALEAYRDLLADIPRFEKVLEHVINEWKYSCEHHLTNTSMNRIAWLGQASLAYELGIPARYRGGFNLLTEDQQRIANETALKYLNIWLDQNGREQVDITGAQSHLDVELY